ncbi:12139_t:CDS:2, partial [Dentiscutata heterogama]
ATGHMNHSDSRFCEFRSPIWADFQNSNMLHQFEYDVHDT